MLPDWFNDPSSYQSATPAGNNTPRVDWFSDPDSYHAAPSEEDKGPTTYHDYADALYSGLHGLGATGASLMGQITTPEFSKYWMAQADAQRQRTQQDIENMSPAGQQAVNAGITDRAFWQHPLRSVALQATQQLPTLAAMGGAAATGGIAGGAASFAAINAGSAVSDFAQVVKNTPVEELNQNPDFAKYSQYMSPDDAKNMFIQDHAGPLAVKAGIVGGVAGLTLEGGLLTRGVEAGPVGLALRGGVTAGASLGVSGAATEALTEQASGQSIDAGQITRASIGQAALGAVTGGIGGLREGLRGQDGVPSKGVSRPIPGRQKLTPEAEPGQFTSTGSDRQGRKPEGQLKPEKNVPERPPGTGEAPPSSGISADQELALKATQPTPGVKDTTQPTGELGTQGEQTTSPEGASVPPSSTPLGAPPTDMMGGELPTHQPPLEKPPVSAPVDRGASTAAVPERPETLQLQQEALAKGQKQVVFYPPNSEVPSKLDTPGVIRTRIPKVGTFDIDTNKISVADVRTAVKEGKLNELLGLGSTTREEAQARSAMGETPVAVVERTPSGTEARTAAATDQTAPAQIQAIEQTKLAPENKVGIEPAQQVIAERQGRILPAVESPADRTQRIIAEKKQAKEILKQAKQVIAEPAESTPGVKHWTKAELAKIASHNIAADRIMNDNPPIQREGITDIYQRARKMVDDAKSEGITIPKELADHHSAGMALLSEAKELTSKDFPGPNAYARFLDREGLLRAGKKDEALGVRKAEGATELGGTEVTEQSTETTPESELLRKESEGEFTKPEPPKKVFTVEKTKRRIPVKKSEEKVAPLITPKEEGEHPEEERVDNIVKTHDLNGKPVTVQYLSKTTTGKILEAVDPKIYPPSMRPIINKLIERFKDLVHDVPVYLMSDNQMEAMKGDRLKPGSRYGGGYNIIENHILLNAELPERNVTHTIMHETFHAATVEGFRNNPILKDLAQRFYNEVKTAMNIGFSKSIPEELKYGLTSPVEMLTEIMSNPAWQDWMKRTPISAELARDLDMPRWRKATLFQGALDWFRKLLGLGPREYNVIEAALNLGERAMWAKEPADEYGYRLRARQVSLKDMQEDGPVSAMISPRNYSGELKELPDRIKDGIVDLTKRSGIGDIVREQGKRFMPMMDMIYNNDKFFGPQNEENQLRQLGHEAMRMEGKRVVIKQQSDSILDKVKDAIRKIPDEINDLHELLQKSDFYNVHPDEELGVGRNKHIKVNQKHIENSNKDNWEAIAHHKELTQMYNNLSDTGKSLFHGIRGMLEKIHKDVLTGTRQRVFSAAMEELNNTIDRPDAAEIKETLQKVYNNDELTPEEEQKYGKDPIIKTMREAGAMMRRQGFYFPAKRFGKYVVTGTHDYEIPGTGVRDPKDPNKIIFANRKDAFNFVSSLDLPSRTETKSDIHVTKGPTEEYHVTVNPKHVEFMDSTYEGEKIAKALRDAGVKDVTNPTLREQNQYLDYSLHAGQVDAFDKALDKMSHVSPDVRASAKEAIHYMAVASMQGNRLNKSFLQKRRVAGADSDILRTLDSYRSSAATFLATQEHMPVINKLLGGVKDAAETARRKNFDSAKDMVAVAQEMENRLTNFKKGGGAELTKSFFHNVAALALWKYLFSPAHFALHLMHPVITSIPEMASEHGWGQTYKAMIQAYKDMGAGENLILGGKGAWQKAWDFSKNPTDFIDSLRTRLLENGRSGATIKMLEELETSGYLTHMGLDFSHFYQKAGGLTYMADRSLGIMQELNNSTESINRVGTAVAAWDLYKGRGYSDEEALGYAKKVLSQTHGLYANINRAPIMMSHPIVRSMLQFKTFPMMIYRILARNVYNIYKNDTPGVRWQAIKALSGMVGTAALFTGAQGATPEPVRLGITMTNLMGLTDSWTQEEDKLRRTLAENISPEVAGVAMGGLSHVLGWDLHHRLGLNDLTVFAEPRTTSPQDVENWFTNAALGVPWGLGMDAYTGYQALLNGDYGKAINLMLPKALADLNKAYQLGTEGKSTPRGNILVPDVGKMGLLGQALGFVPSQVSEAQEARAAYGQELSEETAAKQHIGQLWRSGDKSGALRAIQEFKQKYPGVPISLPQIKSQQNILGYPVTPRNRKELEQRAQDYGITQ